MSFEQLLNKVEQAEQALEARERSLAADWRQFKRTWLITWTPGRIVAAGLVGGFVTGLAKPLKGASGGGVLHLLSTVAGLFASGSAQVAAGKAEQVAETTERVQTDPAAAAAQQTIAAAEAQPRNAAPSSAGNTRRPYEIPDTFRGSGQL